jgi:hypothetical protein
MLCGVNAHVKNGIAERMMRHLPEQARVVLQNGSNIIITFGNTFTFTNLTQSKMLSFL